MTPTDRDLEEVALKLGRALHVRGWRLAAAESCTGGWIAKVLTDVAGSSQWFDGGVVAYSNAAKTALLGVSSDVLAAHGAVSEETVRAMAEGARSRFSADLAVAVSGIAGPGGGTADKPVGTGALRLGRGPAASRPRGASSRRPRVRAPADGGARARAARRSRLDR